MVDAALAVQEMGAAALVKGFGIAAISSRRDVAASSLYKPKVSIRKRAGGWNRRANLLMRVVKLFIWDGPAAMVIVGGE